MGYSLTDLLQKEKDGTIKLATIGIMPEQFDLAVANIEPPKDTILERGIQLIGKLGVGKAAIAHTPKEVPILLVDSVTCAPHKQNVIVHTTLNALKQVVEQKQSEQLLTECAEEYLKQMQRKHPEYVSPLVAPKQFEEPFIIDNNGSGYGAPSKHRNGKYFNPAKKKHKRKSSKKSRRANRK